MLMDRMGLLTPASAQEIEMISAVVTKEEYEAELEFARAVGCVILHSAPDIMSEHCLALYPETGSATVWWQGKVEVRQKSELDGITQSSQVHAINRSYGLTYDGIYRPSGFLQRLSHLYLPAEDIKKRDIVGLIDGTGQTFKSHPVKTIE
jgi:hypothetical protein